MNVNLQKTDLWKRIAAWVLDGVFLCVLVVCCSYCLSTVMDYDGYAQIVEDGYAYYEDQYNTTFDIDQLKYDAMTEQERQAYDAAVQALTADETVMNAYNMLMNLSLLIVTLSIVVAMILLEFVIPLLLRNGATLGKKIFRLGLVRTDGANVSALQLFVRAMIGKCTIETMIPVYLMLMIYWGTVGFFGTIILLGLGIAQIIIYMKTSTNSQIHDLLASTAVVDLSS